MKGTYTQLKLALNPLGDVKEGGGELKYNCPRCEKAGAPKDKFNLQVRYSINAFHCWACDYKGPLFKLIKEYGYKEFLDLFQTTEKNIVNKTKQKRKQVYIPEYCINALNNDEARNYLFSRKITKEQIIQRQIKYCYSGEHKGCIIFPSYNEQNKLTCFVSHNFKEGKYKNYKSEEFTVFYETFIDKRSPIILTEGVYDALVLPNAIPLLGLTISEKLLLFLSNTIVYLIVDSVVEKKQVKKMLKELNKVSKASAIFLEGYKDANEAAQASPTALSCLLKNFY
jgi:DNA primase